jgi:hypothetical protein
MVKVNVQLSLCLINYALQHKDVWESGGTALPFLTLVLDGGEWSASRSGHFTPSTRWSGGWAGSRASLDTVESGEKILPHRELNPGRPVNRFLQ